VSDRIPSLNPIDSERYSRQIRFDRVGEEGQERLLASSAVVVGSGALGSVTSDLLVRAGLGRLRIIDRDFVEFSNLQRQTLFEEEDARQSLPKAAAAERRLRAINSGVEVEGIVADLSPENVRELLDGFSLILDGTDNFETRLLINDAALALNVPWIYAAAVGSYGVTFPVSPGVSACLACLIEAGDAVDPMGAEETCDTAGILNSAASLAASLQSTEAVKFLAGKSDFTDSRLVSSDVWTGRFQMVRVSRNPQCRACVVRRWTYLEGQAFPHITLCGRDSVQIHQRRRQLDLDALGRRLASASVSRIRSNGFLLRFSVAPFEMTVFPDGRAIIKGTKDPSVARSLYARYVGA
jgi:molybdopterin-synthase adenylyltransferase